MADARLEDLDRQIEQGGLTLAELEDLALEGGSNSLPTALTVHFGTALIDEAALDFLARPERDAELAVTEWFDRLGAGTRRAVWTDVRQRSSARKLRAPLARQALTCELLADPRSGSPEALRNATFRRRIPSWQAAPLD